MDQNIESEENGFGINSDEMRQSKLQKHKTFGAQQSLLRMITPGTESDDKIIPLWKVLQQMDANKEKEDSETTDQYLRQESSNLPCSRSPTKITDSIYRQS